MSKNYLVMTLESDLLELEEELSDELKGLEYETDSIVEDLTLISDDDVNEFFQDTNNDLDERDKQENDWDLGIIEAGIGYDDDTELEKKYTEALEDLIKLGEPVDIEALGDNIISALDEIIEETIADIKDKDVEPKGIVRVDEDIDELLAFLFEDVQDITEEKGVIEKFTTNVLTDLDKIDEEAVSVIENLLDDPDIEDILISKCPECGVRLEEDLPICTTCYSALPERSNTVSRGFIHGAIRGRGHVNGFINGDRRVRGRINGMIDKKGNINGIINGVGRLQGKVNGLINGRGRINGLVNGKKEFKGEINGLINGQGRTNGLTNGRGQTNGMINGSGLVFTHQGPTEFHPKHLRVIPPNIRKKRMLEKYVVIGSVLMLMVILFGIIFTSIEKVQEPLDIQIDGDFNDWTEYPLVDASPGPMYFNSNIDILKMGAEDNGGRYLAIYLEVAGNIFEGEPKNENALQDTFFAFIDSDRIVETGYLIQGIGADYVLVVSGWNGEVYSSILHTFSTTADNNDWNGFNPGPTIYSRANGNAFESQIGWEVLGADGSEAVDILFYSQSWDGHQDVADYVFSNDKGLLKVAQQGYGPKVINNQSEEILRLEMTSLYREMIVERIVVSFDGTLPDGAVKRCYAIDINGNLLGQTSDIDNGVAIIQTQMYVVSENSTASIFIGVDIDPTSYPGYTIRATINSPRDIVTTNGTISLRTEKYEYEFSYVHSIPNGIKIDGGFSEWNDFIYDLLNERSTSNNTDIDIKKYDAELNENGLGVYMDVEGIILGGTPIPSVNRVRTPSSDLGEPTERIPVDSDRDGIPDEYEAGYEFDFDNDGIRDSEDTDDDNDLKIDYTDGGTDYWLNQSVTKVVIYIGPVLKEAEKNLGEDYIHIFIDTDNNTETGMDVGNIGAEYLTKITGKYNKIINQSVFTYDSSTSEWTWNSESSNLSIILDISRMEMVIPIYSNGTINLWIETRGWGEETDDIDEFIGVEYTPVLVNSTRSSNPPVDVLAPEFSKSFIPITFFFFIMFTYSSLRKKHNK